jgi:MFS family permease
MRHKGSGYIRVSALSTGEWGGASFGSHPKRIRKISSSPKTSPFDPLKNRGFLIYWLAGLSANFGWQIQLVGASWLMVSLGGTPEQVALVQASVALPVMLLSLPGGTLSDRVGQKVMVLWAQSFLMIVFTAVAVAAYFEALTPSLLLLSTLAVGAGRALYYPGWQSMVFEFFERDKTPAAFAINTGNLNIARSLGPALGGALVASVGAFLAFVVAAISNISVLFVASRWKIAKPSHDLPPEPFGSAILAGLRYIALSPTLLTVILRSCVFNIAAIAVMAMLPLVARDVLQGGPQVYGFLLGAFGIGAVAAAVLSQTLRRLIPVERYLAGAFVTYAVGMVVLGLSPSIILSLIAACMTGMCWILVQVTFGSTNQVSSPRWVISRSIGIYQTFVFGGNALGSLIWGMIAGGYGTPAALFSAAALMVAGAGIGLFLRIKEPDGFGLDPQSDWKPPQPKVDMVMKSGPILTTITYRIREEDVPEFLSVMREKRRNRIRDGAARWTLSRDIQDAELWFERFKVATWADAQRLHSRRTVAGGLVIEAVRKLHQGPNLPEVHYELVRNTAHTPHDRTHEHHH